MYYLVLGYIVIDYRIYCRFTGYQQSSIQNIGQLKLYFFKPVIENTFVYAYFPVNFFAVRKNDTGTLSVVWIDSCTGNTINQ